MHLLIDSDGWSELEINPQQQIYTQKVLPIPAQYQGQQVYIAFIMTATNNGDRWLIDDVSVQQVCVEPTNPVATNVGLTSADLSWGNPSGATQWEIEILPVDAPQSGSGVVYSGLLPYQPVLEPGTDYKYYVRALCG